MHIVSTAPSRRSNVLTATKTVPPLTSSSLSTNRFSPLLLIMAVLISTSLFPAGLGHPITISAAAEPSTAATQTAESSARPPAKTEPVSHHTSFLTMDKVPHVAGIRIEPEELGSSSSGFVGYTDKSMSIVEPDTQVRVVLFGSFLNEIDLLGYTPDPDGNCTKALEDKQHKSEFIIQTDWRIVMLYKFKETSAHYRLCFKQDGDDKSYHVWDDRYAMVSTELPPRHYHFALPLQIAIIAFLLVLSGLFSGLNLGLMSLTPQELTLISNSGSPKEREYAQKILPVRKSGNMLLCSLLIGNVCVNSAISILFDDLTSGYVALVISSFGIVVFGEIFPQALCVKKGLAVGAHTIWVTRFFMVLTFPLAYPISKVLDKLLGDEVVSYDRKRLMELIKLSTKNAVGVAEELKIAIGAFEMGDKTVKDVMTKIDDVFMIPHDTVLNGKVVAEILCSGYTRVPVYAGSRDNVVSLLFVKDLALLDPDDNFQVKTLCDYYQHPVRRVPENTPLRIMLEEFKKGDYHMALVDRMVNGEDSKEGKCELVGLVTLEDIVEEILQAEIVDETDVVMDNVNRIRRRKNQRRDLALFINEGGACQISMQMQLVTIQYLEGNFRAFSPDRIAQSILEKVIRSHVHKVEVSHLADLNDPKTALPRKAKLYTKKQPSDKFVLILEGRALVTIGQNEMTFEVGPWQCFGTELLKQLDQLIDQAEQHHQQHDGAGITTPAAPGSNHQSPALGAGNCAPGAAPVGTVTTTTIRTVTGTGAGADPHHQQQLHRVSSESRPSQGAINAMLAGGGTTVGVQQQPLVDPIGQDAAKKMLFVPDYSVKVISECTYLEINVQTYLSMYRSTLITRNKGEGGTADGLAGAGGVHSNSISGPSNVAAGCDTQPQTPITVTGTMNSNNLRETDEELLQLVVDNAPVASRDDAVTPPPTPGSTTSATTTADEQRPLLLTATAAAANGPVASTDAATDISQGTAAKRKRDGYARTGSGASGGGGGGGLLPNGAPPPNSNSGDEEEGLVSSQPVVPMAAEGR